MWKRNLKCFSDRQIFDKFQNPNSVEVSWWSLPYSDLDESSDSQNCFTVVPPPSDSRRSISIRRSCDGHDYFARRGVRRRPVSRSVVFAKQPPVVHSSGAVQQHAKTGVLGPNGELDISGERRRMLRVDAIRTVHRCNIVLSFKLSQWRQSRTKYAMVHFNLSAQGRIETFYALGTRVWFFTRRRT